MEKEKAIGTIDYPKELAPAPEGKEAVISVRDLSVSFRTDEGSVRAVRGVAFDLYKGETLCIVGESGSGKSVTNKTIMGILPASAHIDSGSIMYEGEDLTKIAEDEFHRIRGTKIGMIFQDPLSSLNPIMKIGKQITEVMIINGNHLKHKYDDLISKELIKYKNDKQLLDIALAEVRFTHRRKSKASAEQKARAVQNYVSEKARLSPIIKADKIALNVAKRTAKIKISVMKAEIVARHKELEAPILKKLLSRPDVSFEKAAIHEENRRFSEQIAALDKRLADSSDKASLLAQKKALVGTHEETIAKLREKMDAIRGKDKIYGDFISERRRYVSELRVTHKEAKMRALRVMQEVGIPEPERRFNQYPFEFSGGMRQRIVIAIALTADPDILICDEPTTALDVTIQAQILELINKLKAARNMSVIFITHDLGVVANMADRVAVMYAGKIVEFGTASDVFYHPAHPYTWALLSSIPDIDSKEKLEAIPGTPPNMLFPPKGDAFALRSKYALGIDFKVEPKMYQLSDTHFAASWLLDENSPEAQMPKIVSTRITNSLRKAGIKND